MTRSESIAGLAAALCAAQAEFTAIPKADTNPFFRSRYAGLPDVIRTASPVLTKHGLAVSQFIGFDERGDILTTWLMHSSGEFLCQSMRLHLAKVDAQGQGSAVTYARRYSYMAVLGLVADEDDDGNRASGAQPAKRATNGGHARPLSDEERQRVIAAMLDADLSDEQQELLLRSVGADSVGELTTVTARQLRKVLDERVAA